jgi:hypothetical protein
VISAQADSVAVPLMVLINTISCVNHNVSGCFP